MDIKKRKYHDDPEKKRLAVKKRYNDKKESIKQNKKEKYVEHQTSNISYKKTKYYAIRIEFKERGSSYVHSFIWIFNTPNIQNDADYIDFIEKTINAQFPNHLNDPELFELVKKYQIHAHTRTCWKYNKNGCRFSYGRYITEKTIIAKPLDSKLNNDEKQEVLAWRNTLLRQVTSYIDDNLNPATVNVIDPTKDNYTQSLSITEILNELEISKDDYNRALSISKDEDLELHLKRPPDTCFVNNYVDVGSKAWQASMDIQPVFNEYKAVTYMCQYFSKTEDQCSQAMKQAAKEDFENNMYHPDTIKTIVNAYLRNREFRSSGGSLPYFARGETKNNISSCLFC